MNKKALPWKPQYLLACDNIAKKLGGCIIITNCDKSLLQITAANLLQITTILSQITTAITNCDKVITNYDSYYKLRQLLETTTEHFEQLKLSSFDFLSVMLQYKRRINKSEVLSNKLSPRRFSLIKISEVCFFNWLKNFSVI